MSDVLTKEKLVEMVREVIKEAALCHDPTDGHFTDCDSGAVYSLSHKAASKNNIDKKYVGRGKVTKNRKLDTPFGMNTSPTKQCGRQTIQGDPKKKDRRCHDYPKGKYQEGGSALLPNADDTPSERSEKIFPGYSQLRQLANGIMEDEDTGETYIPLSVLNGVLARLIDMSQQEGELLEDRNKQFQYCKQQFGLVTRQEAFKSIVDSINAVKRAQDGKLYEPQKS